jgi:cytochrome c biogenesis protein CcdA
VSSIDLNSPPPGHKFNISVERDETEGERKVRLFKDVVLFVVAIIFMLIIFGYCFHTLFSLDTSPDAKRWAQSVLSAVIGGLSGYLIKR